MRPSPPFERDPVGGRVLAFVRRRALLPRGARVIVAVGGGSASLGLLGFLHAARETLGIASLAVASVERDGDETSDEAERVADVGRLARQLDLDFHALRPASRRRVTRAGLVRELEALAAEQGFDRIALGQTRDDVVLRVLHGAITRGAVEAVRGYRARGPGKVVRPLLGVDSYEAAGLCRLLEAEIPPMPEPRRSRGVHQSLREVVIPRIRAFVPGADRALAQLASELEALRRHLAREAARVLEAGACGEGCWEFPRERLETRALRRAIARAVLRRGEGPGGEDADRAPQDLSAAMGRIAREGSGLGLVGGHRVSWVPGQGGAEGRVRVQRARPLPRE